MDIGPESFYRAPLALPTIVLTLDLTDEIQINIQT